MGNPGYGWRVVRDAAGQAVKPIRWEVDPDRPLAPLLAAYSEAGTVLGACRLLDERHIPTRSGKVSMGPDDEAWMSPSLSLILDRVPRHEGPCNFEDGVCTMPHLLPKRGTRRHFASSDVLAGMLRCHCGRTMTPDADKHGYYCARGARKKVAVHGPASVKQTALLPTIRAEADRLAIPLDVVEIGQDDATGRETIAERKRRLGLAFAATAIDEATFRDELAKLTDEVDRLDAAAEIVELPALDWTQPPAVVNGILRALFEPIQLAPDMSIPVKDGRPDIRWRLPQWRAE